jgi:hypothetical protein
VIHVLTDRKPKLKQVIQELNQQFFGWWGAGDPGAKSTVLWLVGILSFNGSKILPQGTENLDNTEITESCLETMEEPEDQGS